MSAGDGSKAPRVCKREGCGRACPVRVGVGAPPRYCCAGCRDAYWKARDAARRPMTVRTERVCALAGCDVRFTPGRYAAHQIYCCDDHSHAGTRVPQPSGRTSHARRLGYRAEARRQALHLGTCPGCQRARVEVDDLLLYCKARCGWDLLVSAKERDPRAGTPEPEEDGDAAD